MLIFFKVPLFGTRRSTKLETFKDLFDYLPEKSEVKTDFNCKMRSGVARLSNADDSSYTLEKHKDSFAPSKGLCNPDVYESSPSSSISDLTKVSNFVYFQVLSCNEEYSGYCNKMVKGKIKILGQNYIRVELENGEQADLLLSKVTKETPTSKENAVKKLGLGLKEGSNIVFIYHNSYNPKKYESEGKEIILFDDPSYLIYLGLVK